MASASELTVAQTAGRSLLQLAAATLQPALPVAIAGFLIGEFVSPVSEQMAVSHKAWPRGRKAALPGRAGCGTGTVVPLFTYRQCSAASHSRVQLLTFESSAV